MWKWRWMLVSLGAVCLISAVSAAEDISLHFSGHLAAGQGTCQQISDSRISCQVSAGSSAILELEAVVSPPGNGVTIDGWGIPPWVAFEPISGSGTVSTHATINPPASAVGQTVTLVFTATTSYELQVQLEVEIVVAEAWDSGSPYDIPGGEETDQGIEFEIPFMPDFSTFALGEVADCNTGDSIDASNLATEFVFPTSTLPPYQLADLEKVIVRSPGYVPYEITQFRPLTIRLLFIEITLLMPAEPGICLEPIGEMTLGTVMTFVTTGGGPTTAADTPPATQGAGEHSTITVSGAKGGTESIRDDELAQMIKKAIEAAENKPTSVKVFFNSCYGGGMLDDIADMLSDFDPAIPFVGGSASSADEPAWGPGNESVGNSDKGSYWTDSLATAIGNASDKEKVSDTIGTTNSNDSAAGSNSAATRIKARGDSPEHPQNTSANGGGDVTWGPAETVVFSGNNNRKRHDNNVTNMEQAFLDKFSQTYSSSNNGSTKTSLQNMLNAAASDLDGKEELILYVDDHGDTEFDVDEWWDSLFDSGPIMLDPDIGWSTDMVTEPLVLHPGWQTGLAGNVEQGDPVNPGILIALDMESAMFPDGLPIHLLFEMYFNGERLPIPEIPGTPDIDLFIPVPWFLIQPGENTFAILPTDYYSGGPALAISNLELVSGPINELDIEYVSPDPAL